MRKKTSLLLIVLSFFIFKNAFSQKKYIVTNLDELISYTTMAKDKDTIFVGNKTILNLTGQNIIINKGVKFLSERGSNKEGALLYSNSFYPELSYTPLILMKDSSEISGFRIQGPNKNITDHNQITQRGVANAIKIDGYNVKILNNEIYNFDKWAVWAYKSQNNEIAYNYIHHTKLAGYGYGVWVGGYGSEKGGMTYIHHNIFDNCRHAIASSGSYNSWFAYNNFFLRQQTFVNLDRHGQGRGTIGGVNTWVKNNVFYSRQIHFGFPLPAVDSGTIVIENNYFARDTNNFGFIAGEKNDTLATKVLDKRFSLKNNFFNESQTSDLNTNLILNTKIGKSPLNLVAVCFNEGKRYYWGWGYTKGETITYKGEFSKRFVSPSVMSFSCWVQSDSMKASKRAKQTLIVEPEDSTKKILVASIKDSYNGNLTKRYEKQVWINNTIIWRDDVAGNEEWTNLIIDVTKYLTGISKKDTIKLRLASINGEPNPQDGIIELNVWFDDIYIFNTGYKQNFEPTTFEEHPTVLSPWRQFPNGIGSGITSEESKTGEYSYSFDIGYKQIWKNKYAELYCVIF